MPTNPYEPPKGEDELTTWGVLRLIVITLAITLSISATFLFGVYYLMPAASD